MLTDPIRLPLPGERFIDLDLVGQALADTREASRQRGLDGPLGVANAVLKCFFRDDPTMYRSRSRRHASFRRFVTESRMARSVVSRAVGTWEQVRVLPADVAGALPATHHYLLLPVENRELKRELARRAVAERLTCRELSRLVRAARADARGPGAALTHEMGLIHRALDSAMRLSSEAALDAEIRHSLADDVGRQIERLLQLRAALSATASAVAQ